MSSATTRRSRSLPDARAIAWPRVATLLDLDAVLLCEAEVLGPPHDGRLSFGDVREPAALLDYYFGYGERRLMLLVDGATVEGSLETRYEGGQRSWWLELDTERSTLSKSAE